MKYLKCLIISIVGIFIFTTSNCFAIDQKLIGKVETYEATVKNLEDIKVILRIEKKSYNRWLRKLGEHEKEKRDSVFYSPYRVKFYQDKIVESKNKIEELNVKYNEVKKEVKRLEPIVEEYNKQMEIEHKREDFKCTVMHFGKIIGFPIAFLVFISFLSRLITKRNKRLLKKGKITRKEYDRLVASDNKSKSMFSDDKGANPATGLPLVGNGVCDAGGNIRGSSSDRSMFDHDRDYSSRNRWDDY